MTKELNRHFSKGIHGQQGKKKEFNNTDQQEMQIKAIMRYHITLVGMAITETNKVNKTQEITYIGKNVVGKQIGVTTMDNSMKFS